jgi:glycosyltransferase involved in cell wall biosynthesis
LYPSYYREGIPRSVLEALSMSLPIITTKMPGCRLTVIENENGFLIESKSSTEILTAAQKMINEPDLSSFGAKSRQIAETRFSNEIIFKQIKNLY